MGATIKNQFVLHRKGQTIILTDEEIREAVVITFKDGVQLVLDPEDKLELDNQTVTLVCDSPKCASRSGANEPTTVVLDDQKAKQDPLSVPDSFWHGVKAHFDPRDQRAFWFCSTQCCKDYVTYYYVPPKTPRELQEQQKLTEEALKTIEAANAQGPVEIRTTGDEATGEC